MSERKEDKNRSAVLPFEAIAPRVVDAVLERLAASGVFDRRSPVVSASGFPFSPSASASVSFGGDTGGGEVGALPGVICDAPGQRVLWLVAAPCGHLAQLAQIWRRLARRGHFQQLVVCVDVAQRFGEQAQDVLAAQDGWGIEKTFVLAPPADPALNPRSGLKGVGIEAGTDTALGTGTVEVSTTSRALEALDAAAVVYVGALAWNQAFQLSRMDDGDPFVQLILAAVSAQKRVCCLRDETLSGLMGCGGARGERSAQGGRSAKGGRDAPNLTTAVTRRSQNLWRELESLGIQGLPLDAVFRPLQALEAAQDSFQRAHGGLVTEKDIEAVIQNGLHRLTLAPGTLVTPLAADRARELGVVLKRTE